VYSLGLIILRSNLPLQLLIQTWPSIGGINCISVSFDRTTPIISMPKRNRNVSSAASSSSNGKKNKADLKEMNPGNSSSAGSGNGGSTRSYICCICCVYQSGYGSNPAPLTDEGECCDECNKKVIEARQLPKKSTSKKANKPNYKTLLPALKIGASTGLVYDELYMWHEAAKVNSAPEIQPLESWEHPETKRRLYVNMFIKLIELCHGCLYMPWLSCLPSSGSLKSPGLLLSYPTIAPVSHIILIYTFTTT